MGTGQRSELPPSNSPRVNVLWPFAIGALALQRLPRDLGKLQIGSHLDGALAWIVRARASGSDGGIPANFDLVRNRWAASYPETTGYTVPTLLACARRLHGPDLRSLALSLADYLLDVGTLEGGVGHWKRRADGPQTPVVFDTGQVILGWLAAWHDTRDARYLDAAVAAAEWLLQAQDETGAWIQYQHLGYAKVIDARVAWAMLKVAQAYPAYTCESAVRSCLDWVLSQQQGNGWFNRAGFQAGRDPFTHTIAYTAEGLLESGILLDEPRYTDASRKVADVLLTLQRTDGSLASTYDDTWHPTSRSSCLTGNCQIALLWHRFYELLGDTRYLEAASRAIAFVAATQNLTSSHPGVRGAIAGSFPVYGRYERLKYPNWAAKFFIDALLALADA